MLISWHWTNIKGPLEEQPIGTYQCAIIGEENTNTVFHMRQSSHFSQQSQQSVSVQDSNRVGAHDARYAAMSVLNTHIDIDIVSRPPPPRTIFGHCVPCELVLSAAIL
jgi:hypothetical protein